ncbi:MAG: aminotransferase class IV family protein [Pseudomonadota bacterium]|uniref:aminotransferase class IV family protein n=1 Tax=Roseovarius TaxID=74030 RepID=UPI0022A88CB8|nr:aminotransferase class IV family protein [Roseovarius sp. EGI FJ00037]MCZ0813132.1 aminotransferase class IV family protein [Roseovarius sp. EGI FJ00037]
MEGPLRPPPADDFRLIETMLWTPDGGVSRRARHLARLARSASRLGIAPRGVERALDAVRSDAPQRLRLTVARDGQAELAVYPFTPLPSDTVWHLGLARARLSSADPWLGVKTTERALYEAARADMPDGIDELIFLNERDELCEGTITNLFVDPGTGVLLTPPLSSGVLPGILREELIDSGRAREAALTLADLRAPASVFVGNSLRGLIAARLD